MPGAPQGTIALLFTDVEGSTSLARRAGPAWAGVLREHHGIVGGAIAEQGGYVDGTEGDAFFATFTDPVAAARAAVSAQTALRRNAWPEAVGGELKVRMGLHVGHVERAETGYVGLEVHRAARVASAAHGGQLLLTATATAHVGEHVPTDPLGTHRLKDFPVPEQLFCAVIDGRGASSFPPPRTLDVRQTNLPAGRPPLVGRDRDLARVREALLDPGQRLVTLTGRGGAGKTSLALAAGTDLLDEHPGGVWWVPLADLTAPERVTAAIAAEVGAGRDADREPVEAVVARLRERGRVLLVLDNLEHLPGAARQILALLDALPDLRILATSQVPLRLAGERCLPLDMLDEKAGLELLGRVAGRSDLRSADDPALAGIVRLLDGLPLALELAGARLGVLTPASLLERLERSTDLLKDRRGDRPDRHRSLQATIEWSLGLLGEDERALFERMGVFAEPVELEHIEAVAGADGIDVLDALEALLDVALIRRVESGDGRVRFGLPEALRRAAADRLDAAPDGERWHREHARFHRDLVWRARLGAIAEASAFRAAANADREILTALRWALAHDDELAGPLAAGRALVLLERGRTREGAETLKLLDGLATDPSVDVVRLIAKVYFHSFTGDQDGSIAAAAAAAQIDASPEVRALAQSSISVAHLLAGQTEEALRAAALGVERARESGPASTAAALLMETQALIQAGRLEEARARLHEADGHAAIVCPYVYEKRETVYGDLELEAGRPHAAIPHYVRSLLWAEANGDEGQIAFDLAGLALALAAAGADEPALEAQGLAHAQVSESQGRDVDSLEHILDVVALDAAAERVGLERADTQRALGRGVAPGRRVSRACELARLVGS
jgi:predicted ATPase/class 3 adenylate cyclase